MKRCLHLVAVYLGLREDPELNARREAEERPGARAMAFRLALAAVIGLAGFSLLAWITRLLDGEHPDLETVVRAGALKLLIALGIWAVVAAIRWALRWYERSSEDA